MYPPPPPPMLPGGKQKRNFPGSANLLDQLTQLGTEASAQQTT